jgi:hypothetical protein
MRRNRRRIAIFELSGMAGRPRVDASPITLEDVGVNLLSQLDRSICAVAAANHRTRASGDRSAYLGRVDGGAAAALAIAPDSGPRMWTVSRRSVAPRRSSASAIARWS